MPVKYVHFTFCVMLTWSKYSQWFYTTLFPTNRIVSRDWVTIDGVWIGNGFTGLLKFVTTSNSSAVANSNTVQLTTARIKLLNLLCPVAW
jgi:hypothetical protein